MSVEAVFCQVKPEVHVGHRVSNNNANIPKGIDKTKTPLKL